MELSYWKLGDTCLPWDLKQTSVPSIMRAMFALHFGNEQIQRCLLYINFFFNPGWPGKRILLNSNRIHKSPLQCWYNLDSQDRWLLPLCTLPSLLLDRLFYKQASVEGIYTTKQQFTPGNMILYFLIDLEMLSNVIVHVFQGKYLQFARCFQCNWSQQISLQKWVALVNFFLSVEQIKSAVRMRSTVHEVACE